MVYRVGVEHLSRYLSEVDIFKGLSDRHLDRIAGLCEEWSFQAGEYLSIQNETGSRLYVIRRGEIEITTGHGDTRLMVRTVSERESNASGGTLRASNNGYFCQGRNRR